MNLISKIFFALILFTSTTVFGQLPDNIGFEKGNFDGWECSSGTRNATSTYSTNSLGQINGRHTIIGLSQKDELDPYGHFPVLCPNGSGHSVKLGNEDIPRYVSRISRTIPVPKGAATYSLVFNYAMVLDANDNHTNKDDQPVFKVEIFDVVSGDALACSSFNFVATSKDLPGFTASDVQSIKPNTTRTNPIYRDWSTAMINLTNFAGRDIRLEFTTADCNGTLHFAYAYIDIDEKLSLNPITGNVFCNNQTVTTLTGPTGFADYVWYKKNDLANPIPGQSITVPAVNGKEYELHITPYLNLGCPEILHTMLQELPEPFILNVKREAYGCLGIGVNLRKPDITLGSSTGMEYSYFKNIEGTVYLPNPDAVLTAGTYYIRGTNAGGCTDIRSVKVILNNPNITAKDPPPVQYPTKVDLSTTFTNLGFNYKYFSDAVGTIEIDKYVNVTGTYYIKATNGTPCSVIVPVKIVVNPPPPYTIEASNTFTPNGDGINDYFFIKTTGYVSLTQLAIFNRYGQQVFFTRSIYDYWKGNNGTTPLPVGTYYWIFNGTDDYFHTNVKKAASITIIR